MAPTDSDIAVIQELWREYWDALGLSDDFQNFAAELASLPGQYRLLLVTRVRDEAAGTIALRPVREDACEIKRLYVRPAYRGQGLGRGLLDRMMADAYALGYRQIFADTLPSMTSARQMYREAGFVETGPYSESPTPGAVFLRFDF